jgi:hypothetical protein
MIIKYGTYCEEEWGSVNNVLNPYFKKPLEFYLSMPVAMCV